MPRMWRERERDPDEGNFPGKCCRFVFGWKVKVQQWNAFHSFVLGWSKSQIFIFFPTGEKVENCQNFGISSSCLSVLQDDCAFLYFVNAFSWTVYVEIIIYFKIYIVYYHSGKYLCLHNNNYGHICAMLCKTIFVENIFHLRFIGNDFVQNCGKFDSSFLHIFLGKSNQLKIKIWNTAEMYFHFFYMFLTEKVPHTNMP